MRTLLGLASVALLIAGGFGCGDDTTSALVADLAMTPPDMSVPHDMQTLSCAQIISCEMNAADAAAQGACVAEGNTSAKLLIASFIGCLVGACNPDAGNANGSCSGLTDTSAGCLHCIQATGTGAAIGGVCHTEFLNCEAM